MAFSKNTWNAGDKITAALLNRLEQALADHDTALGGSALSTTAQNVRDAINELKGIIPDVSNYYTKTEVDTKVSGSGGGNGTITANSLTDLQAAYPNGLNQPVWVIADQEWYYWSGTVTPPADTTAPNNVTNLITSSVTSSTLTLSWTASTSTDIASYDIYQGATLLGNTASTSYNVAGLTQNTSYTFTVKAKDTSGNVATGASVTQLTATAADTTAPNNVTNLTTSNISTTSVTLNWTASNSSDVASYDIYNGSTFVANTANTSYTVTGLTASTSYTLTVKAKDSSGNVATGTQVTFTTAAPSVDTTPPVITASPAAGTYTSNQSVTLSSNETGTTIYYTTDGSTPTTSSTVYSIPITVSATETIQFIGKDASGNISTPVAATYTINASSSWVTSGLVNKWDNLTNKVSLTDTNSQYLQPTADFTICATFKPKAYANIFSNYLVGSPSSYRFYIGDNGNLVFGDLWGTNNGTAVYPQMRPNTVLSSATTYYHVAIIRSGGNFKIYINNVHDATGDLNYGTYVGATSTNPIIIGENSSDYKTVVYYNRALSDAELTQNYSALS